MLREKVDLNFGKSRGKRLRTGRPIRISTPVSFLQTSSIIDVETDAGYLVEKPSGDRENNQSSRDDGVPCPAGIVLEEINVHTKETLFSS